MNSFFEFLFKYPPVMYERGALSTASALPTWVPVGVLTAVAALSVWLYLRTPTLGRHDKIVFAVVRALAFGVLCVCLMRPVLVVSAAIPQRNVVAVMVDDSRSMQIADQDSSTRAAHVLRLVGGRDSALVKALSERFQLRYFRTSGAGGRTSDLAGITFNASRTRLVPSLMRAEDDLQGAPVAGIVLLSDGADNSATTPGEPGLSEQVLALRARGMPVFAVGVGQEELKRDTEIARVEAPRAVLRNAALAVDAVITQRGFAGRKVNVVVEDNGRIVGTAPVTLPRDGEAVVAHLRIPTAEAGARVLTVRVPVQPGEMIAENNERRALVAVRDRREKILYVEGEPRFELKFMRRAVEDDANLQLVTLLRSAKDKYLRLSVDDSVELSTGFPTTRDDLFGYRAVVLGSIEASFFTLDQLRMLADFVGVRGGGLLALGGRRSLAEGGYAGTPLADVLPIELNAGTYDSTGADEIAVVPTAAGAVHPAMQLAGTDSGTAARWPSMPHLTMVNRIGRAKPGATVLLDGVPVGANGGARLPVLAFQRYGRGKAASFAVQDSWLWQMAAEVPVEDMSHETFWRQVLRWLASDVPDRVDVAAPDDAGPGEGIAVRATVSDPAYVRSNGATVLASVGADGTAQPMEWAADRDGEYRTTVVPGADGVQEIRVRAVVGRDTLRAEPAYVRVGTPATEYFGASMRPALLQQLAEETGGRFYREGNALDIARDIVYSASGATVVERHDLWDMPAVFALLVSLLGAEWWWRRRRGLA